MLGGGSLAHRSQDGLEEPTQGAAACHCLYPLLIPLD